MGQALYRQYRPKSLVDVVGQEHITKTLAQAIKQGKLAHAYLFTGPRGVGKTSIARILAHEINGLPYDDDSMHLDIIEIDAASNRRIDEIRELRDKVHTAPTSAKYKVYIIDEVHMLTRESFNALLKTLEEPPAHAIFILATTEVHKLPETIISRTQRFIFRPYPLEQVAGHLAAIAKNEDIKITDDALNLVAGYGEGSFRDSIGLLDQTRGHDGEVDADFVRSLIGVPTTEAIDALRDAMAGNDSAAVVSSLADLRHKGFSAPQVAKYLGQRLRADILAGNAPAGSFDLLTKLLDVPSAHDPEAFLELSVLAVTLAGQPAAQPLAPVAAAPARVPEPARSAATAVTAAPSVASTPAPRPIPKPTTLPAAKVEPGPEPAKAAAQPQPLHEPIEVDDNLWPEVLNTLKKSHNTLYGIARMAKATFTTEGLELGFGFEFHRKRINETKNKDIIATIIKSLTGKDMPVHCVAISKDTPVPAVTLPPSSPPASGPAASPPLDDASFDAINSIFGGAEVLEK